MREEEEGGGKPWMSKIPKGCVPMSVNIPKELRDKAKLYALTHDKTLREVVIEGLEMRLEEE